VPRKQEADAQTILRIGIVAALFAGGLSLAAWSLGLEVQSPEDDTPSNLPDDPRISVLGEMAGRVSESSGVAVSRRYEGVVWTHNDQGSSARLYAVSHDGELRSTVVAEGASATDWEDIALATCPATIDVGGDCLYIADTGDNSGSRRSYDIYVLPEPDPSEGETSARIAARLQIRYSDGPADTEALAVNRHGDLLLVTKGNSGESALYRIPAATVAQAVRAGSTETYEVLRVGTLPLDVSTRQRRITGAAVSPDGRILAVRSLTSIYLFDLDQPLAVPRLCDVGPRQPQGEGIDFLDDTTLILSSERVGGRAPILRVRCDRV
jgi:hypothetical protein